MEKIIEDIVREMRKLGKLDEKSTDRIPRSLMGLGLRTYADRIEKAVAKMETATPTCEKSSQVGNTAKMREALEAVVKVGYPYNFHHEAPHISGYCYEITTAINKCFVALSAPPRNCDKFKTKEEAALAYAGECNAFIPQSILWQIGEWLDWLFAETKGETK